MHHVVLERWSRADHVLHRRHATVKIVALLAFLVAVATTPGWQPWTMAAYAAWLLAGIAAARLPVGPVLLRAAVVLPLAAMFAAVAALTGEAARAGGLIAKSYLSALAVLILVATTPMPQLARAAAGLGIPRFLVEVIQFLYRYLFVLSEQAQHMRLAAQCRGGGGFFRRPGLESSRFRAAAGSVAVLFSRSYGRAEGIHRAMLARGFRGQVPVLALRRAGAPDIVFGMLAVAVPLLIRLYWERLPWNL